MGLLLDWWRGARLVQDQQDFNRAARRLGQLAERGEWDEGLEHRARRLAETIGIRPETVIDR